MPERPPTLPGPRNRAIVRALAGLIFLIFGVLDLIVGHLLFAVIFLVLAAVLLGDAVRKRSQSSTTRR